MNFITVKDPPEYSDKMRMLETSDPDHADTFNVLFQQLLNNDIFIKKMADEAVKAMKEMVNSKGGPEGVASLDKDGKIPKEQINLDASDVGAVQRIQVNEKLSVSGWYRFAVVPTNSIFSLKITIASSWNNSAPFVADLVVNIRQVASNGSLFDVRFSQVNAIDTGTISAVRVITSNPEGILFELYYNANSANRIFVSMLPIEPLNNLQTKPLERILNTPEGDEHKFVFNAAGMIADRAISDGLGNNISETYTRNSESNKVYVIGNDASFKKFDATKIKAGDIIRICGVGNGDEEAILPQQMLLYPTHIILENSKVVFETSHAYGGYEITFSIGNGTLIIREPVSMQEDIALYAGSNLVPRINLKHFSGTLESFGVTTWVNKAVENGYGNIMGCYLAGTFICTNDVKFINCRMNALIMANNQRVTVENCIGRLINEEGYNYINYGHVLKRYTASGNTEMEAVLHTIYDVVKSNEHFEFSLVTSGVPGIENGNYYCEGYRGGTNYMYFTATSYPSTLGAPLLKKVRMLVNGAWSAWLDPTN